MGEPPKPSVLFVCVKNSGKSQMAAGLMSAVAGAALEVHSAGTRPGVELNRQSVQSLAELGIDISGEHPKPIDPALLQQVDVVVVLGRDAAVEPVTGVSIERWQTDEPSERGIEGVERMRLIRDDIAVRVEELARRLGVADPGMRRSRR